MEWVEMIEIMRHNGDDEFVSVFNLYKEDVNSNFMCQWRELEIKVGIIDT